MPKVLFVEDDPFIAEIYIKKFEASGFEVENVTTGKATLKEVAENKYDLILLDLVIPEMSGMEVLKEIQENPEYPKDLRIVIFSNLSSQEDREQCLALGASGFISKTEFSPSEVVTEVNRFLRQFSEQGKNEARLNGTAEAVPAAEVPGTKKKRILLIEDEAVFVEMFGKRLRDEGYEVVDKRDGNAGLEEACKGGYDMVISDIMMPGKTGHEMVVELRDTEAGKHIPIFLLSASVEEEHMQELSDAGIVNRVFQKTQITPSELVYAVNEYFEKEGK
ncbi:MAG: hypothetical protein A2808_03330 [Candidatus Moranbacteria bacterium RIFCSPHIGHO2_01_FULL_55_24]|nr:MAG: hypothetical protein A2808_03330 [Candidatus Moranbacteria bacterium RIFCSPHIGHO2_01_FULL_55_24]